MAHLIELDHRRRRRMPLKAPVAIALAVIAAFACGMAAHEALPDLRGDACGSRITDLRRAGR